MPHWLVSFWGSFSNFLPDIRSIVLVVSLLANAWLYFFKPFRVKSFLAGQWSGSLTDDKTITVSCLLVILVDKKQLSGHLFYEGQRETQGLIRGFDRLINNSKRFKAARSWRRFSPFKDTFYIYMQRDIHSVQIYQGGAEFKNPISDVYEYKFSIVTRLGSPRLDASVTIPPILVDGESVCLKGEFTKDGA